MKTTKRQIRFSLLRGSEISGIAAQLLQYLEPGVPPQRVRVGAAEPFPDTRRDSEPLQFTVPEPDVSAPWQMATEPAAETAKTAWLQPLQAERATPGFVPAALPVQELRDFSFDADAAENLAAQLRISQPRPTAGAQQTMDGISEFFRRDSRRYDRVFSGGNGA